MEKPSFYNGKYIDIYFGGVGPSVREMIICLLLGGGTGMLNVWKDDKLSTTEPL